MEWSCLANGAHTLELTKLLSSEKVDKRFVIWQVNWAKSGCQLPGAGDNPKGEATALGGGT